MHAAAPEQHITPGASPSFRDLQYPSAEQMKLLNRADVSPDELAFAYGRGTPEALQRRVLEKETTGRILQTVLTDLRENLPADLLYHGLSHTQIVLAAVIELGLQDDLSGRDIDLLRIAAVNHDWGYTIRSQDNEVLGKEHARKIMHEHRLLESCILDVAQMIDDTKIQTDPETEIPVQKPVGRLSPYLLDADLSALGRRDYLHHVLALHQEVSGIKTTQPEDFLRPETLLFFEENTQFLAAHSWHTHAAEELWGEQKQKNVRDMHLLIHSVKTGNQQERDRLWQELFVESKNTGNRNT